MDVVNRRAFLTMLGGTASVLAAGGLVYAGEARPDSADSGNDKKGGTEASNEVRVSDLLNWPDLSQEERTVIEAALSRYLSSGGAGSSFDGQQIEILESGFYNWGEYLTWWAICRNPNEHYYLDQPMVRATAYDGAGQIVGSDDGYVTVKHILKAYPGQVFAVTGLIPTGWAEISGVEMQPVLLSPGEFHVWDGEAPTFDVTDISEVPTWDGVNVSGVVTNSLDYAADILLIAIFRDWDGQSFIAYDNWCDGVPPQGSSPFTITCSNVPEYASVEVYTYAQRA